MGDPWQYRIRVTGPDRDKWFEKATEHTWGVDDVHGNGVLIDWPMDWSWDGERRPAGSTWYNVRVSNSDENDYAEFFGNFSGAPGLCFGSDRSEFPRNRWGPPLFDGLRIEAEIVGHSWHADAPSGVYSYRDIYRDGKLVSSERANDASIVERFAPELLVAFPDHLTPEERSAREDPAEESADPAGAVVTIGDCPPMQLKARVRVVHSTERCEHGVPFEESNKDNGCEECARTLRAYLDGLRRRVL